MEDLIGLLVVGTLALIGVFQKVKDSREEAKRQEKRVKRRQELPEDTRRMLYGGTGEIPTAKPKGTVQPTPQRQAIPQSNRPKEAQWRQKEQRSFRPAEQGRTTATNMPQPQAAPLQPRQQPVWRQAAPQQQGAPRHAPRQRPLSPAEARRRMTQTLHQAWRQGQSEPERRQAPQRRANFGASDTAKIGGTGAAKARAAPPYGTATADPGHSEHPPRHCYE